jgi:hypothetical protein
VTFRVFVRGRLVGVITGGNLFVNDGRPALAKLLGGDAAGEFASAIGFGSSGTAPAATDTGLTAAAYYKTLDSHSQDGSGSVTFNWSLGAEDTGAQGITIQELGLFADRTSVGLPGSTAPTPLLARKTIAPISFGPSMSITGSWTLTF